jgi:hypothetical protein
MQVPWIEDIDKDLHRSFPQHPFYQKKENLQPLRRVLMAYALRNPSLGYCQSMVSPSTVTTIYSVVERCMCFVVAHCLRRSSILDFGSNM